MAGRRLAITVLLWLTFTACNGQFHSYNCVGGRDVMVHLFEWHWDAVANECENFLAAAGYCAVQVSPPQEHVIVTDPWRPWWERYQPVSYVLESRGGNRQAFQNMVSRCNNAGVRVYADVVINHMTGGGSGTGSAGNPWNTGWALYGEESYPAVPYGPLDFNPQGFGPGECPTENMEIGNYNDAVEVRNCRLLGLRDLKLADEYVRGKVVEYMNDLIDIGVAGFRVDAVKHMWPGDLDVVYNRLNNLNTAWFPGGTRPFIFQEVIDLYGSEAITAGEYTHLARVTEFKYGLNLCDCILGNHGQRLSFLRNFGEDWDFMQGWEAAVFIDNHDNQRGHGGAGDILTYHIPDLYKMSVAYMLAWNYGYPRVMSSYDFDRTFGTEDGPPADGNGNVDTPNCNSQDWICEHRWRQIANMVKFHNRVVGMPVNDWWDNDNNQIAFGRGDRGFVVMNRESYDLNIELQTGLPPGEYCDVISCTNSRPPCQGWKNGPNCRNPINVDGMRRANFHISNNYNWMEEVPMIAIMDE